MKCGGHYPVGGSSEIAFNILPVIEVSRSHLKNQTSPEYYCQSAGGRVLVRASVTTILEKGGKVCGVRVAKVGTQLLSPHQH